MRKYRLLSLIIAVTFVVPALHAQIKSPKELVGEVKASINWVTAQEAHKMIQTMPNLVVVDVRESGEYLIGHLPKAISIPRGLLEFRIGFVTKDPNRPILVYCLSGGRAALAYKALEKMGYKKLYNLKGGYKAWKKAGLPISKKPVE